MFIFARGNYATHKHKFSIMEQNTVLYEKALVRWKRSLEIKRVAEKRMAEEWARRGITGKIVSL